jgi:diguanylate cyclase (GGDEF)-like protein
MEPESTPVVPANRLLEVAGVLSDGAARLHDQLRDLPPAERRALLEVVVSQVGDIVQAWSELVRAVVSVGDPAPLHPGRGSEPGTDRGAGPGEPGTDRGAGPGAGATPETSRRGGGRAGRSAEAGAATTISPLRPSPEPAEVGTKEPAGLTRDELTGVLNRQSGFAALAREIDRSRQDGLRFVLGYLNVDGLRQVNDADGPRAGDELLRKVTSALRATLRSYDVILRLAGDEFLFSLPGADLATAEQRLREFTVILSEEAPGASVSVGFAELRAEDTLEELVARADDALVQARRRRGRPRLR